MKVDSDANKEGSCPYNALFFEKTNNPFPILTAARAEQSIFYSEVMRSWVVTRYEDVISVLNEPNTFSSQIIVAPRKTRPAIIHKEFGERQLDLVNALVVSDPPLHTRLKALMMPAFAPSRIKRHEAFIKELCHRLIDGFQGKGQTDLVSDYTSVIPPLVIGYVIGAPEGDRPKFSGWVQDMLTLFGAIDVSESDLEDAWRGVYAFEDYITSLIADRRREPKDDLTSDFILASLEEEGPAMSDTEILWNVFNIASAGTDTTGLLIAHTLHLMLHDRTRWQSICEDLSLIPTALEEAMRLRSPVRGLFRKVTQNTELGGVTLREGDTLIIHLGSANHDEEIFDCPEQFNIQRKNVRRHLGFGSRYHACIGVNLARLEARVAIEALASRLPELELAVKDEEIRHNPYWMVPSFTNLMARWHMNGKTV